MNKKPKMIYLGRRKGYHYRNHHKPRPTWLGYDWCVRCPIIIQRYSDCFISKYKACYTLLEKTTNVPYERDDLPLLHKRFGTFPKCKKENKVLKVKK